MGLCTSKVEVKSLYNRNKLSLNRKGITAFAVFLLSFFAGIWDKPVSSVGCRSPPANLDFSKNSDWRKLEWHITTDGKNANGVSGKKPRKEFYGNAVLTRIPSRRSVSMTGRILMQPDGFTAI